MITVISCTNRSHSNTMKFAQIYAETLRATTSEGVELISLEDVQEGLLKSDMYQEDNISETLKKLQDTVLIPTKKYVFVVPEYNGSIPGVLKLFIDALSIRKLKETFGGKKALLVGVAMGRAGNLRGLEHLTGMLCHIGMMVHPNRLPISGCHLLLNDANKIKDDTTSKIIQNQINDFLSF